MYKVISKIIFYLVLISFIPLFSLQAKKYEDGIFDVCSLARPSFSDIVETLTPAVVNISTTQTIANQSAQLPNLFAPNSPFEDLFKDFFGQIPNQNNQKQTVSSLGSGFIISDDGYIITNNHVVEKADKIDVKLNDGSVKRAKIIGVDKKTDIAVLKVQSDKKLPFVEFGDSDNARVGDWVIAIGNPFGLGGTVTAGIISARGRNINMSSNVDFIQTDAAINRGNSGGPMFDIDGKLIGINTAIYSNSGGNIGIGFAIPSQTALPIIRQLKQAGHVTRGWLGVNIQIVTEDMANALGLDKASGAYVISVTKDSPAEKGGLKSDDLILEFNGKKIDDVYKLPRIVASTKIGSKVNLLVLRNINNKLVRKTLTVTILKLEDEENHTNKSEDIEKYQDILGMKLTTLNDQLKKKYKIDNHISGLLVRGFTEKSNTRLAGVEKNDILTKVNQISLKDINHFKEIIMNVKKQGKKYILLTIKRGNNISMIITLNIE